MTVLSSAPVEEILRWSSSDPLPHDLTVCHTPGQEWHLDPFAATWHRDGRGPGYSWHQLTAHNEVTKYREVA